MKGRPVKPVSEGYDDIDLNDLDEGIRDTVLLLRQGGFKTFTSCEGGRGHSFQHETIGMELKGTYAAFHQRLIRFLRSHGMESFTISLVTDYSPSYPDGKSHVYLAGLDILSERKRKQVIESSRRRDRKLRRRLEGLGIEVEERESQQPSKGKP